MQKTLALSRYAPGHPLRRQLVENTRRAEIASEDSDIKLFALSFTAFFICIYAFIF